MKKQNKQRLGFTLIEVLVVVSILLILTAVLIPRLRTINKERSLREGARVTGSIFTQASQRAIADGVSGVLLKYNPNFSDGTGYSSAVSNMSLLRAVPTFAGDQEPATGVGAFQTGTAGTVSIPYPIEQDDLQIIKSGDSIGFGQSSSRYTILTVTPTPAGTPTTLNLLLDVSYLPDPDTFIATAGGEGTAYTVHRLPRELRSSEVELPRNIVVDMRFSGFNMLDSGFEQDTGGPDMVRPVDVSTGTNRRNTSVFEPNPRLTIPGDVVNFTTSDIAILFNERGEMDRMVRLATDNITGTTVYVLQELAIDNLQLFITEVITDVDLTDPNDNPINSPTNLWVTVNRSTGTANVGYNLTLIMRRRLCNSLITFTSAR